MVVLDDGEAGLPARSVVVVSQISAVSRGELGAYVGRLTPARVDQVLAGLQFLQRSGFLR